MLLTTVIFYNLFRRLHFIVKKNLSPKFKRKYRDINLLVLTEFNYTICNGPFIGMKYISKSNASSLSPKIIGTYEMELHPIIEDIISINYKNIVDIGCAEGYYAVGFAYRLKDTIHCHVYAYDTNKEALENLTKLTKINSVMEKITVNSYFDHNEFSVYQNEHTLIFCDIEGDELYLLNPEQAPSLLTYDILVEIHDGGEKSDTIKKALHTRFSKTHYIQLIKYTNRTAQDAKKITWTTDSKQRERAINEGRKYGLEWMWMKRI